MKRFFAFYGENHSAQGGMSDFIGDFDDLEEAIHFIREKDKNEVLNYRNWEISWGEVWDSEDRKFVWESGSEKK